MSRPVVLDIHVALPPLFRLRLALAIVAVRIAAAVMTGAINGIKVVVE